MFQIKYPEMFNKVVNEIKPYFNSYNKTNYIYELFIDIADKASLQYVLCSDSGGDILTEYDMELYNSLTSDKDWIKNYFKKLNLN